MALHQQNTIILYLMMKEGQACNVQVIYSWLLQFIANLRYYLKYNFRTMSKSSLLIMRFDHLPDFLLYLQNRPRKKENQFQCNTSKYNRGKQCFQVTLAIPRKIIQTLLNTYKYSRNTSRTIPQEETTKKTIKIIDLKIMNNTKANRLQTG